MKLYGSEPPLEPARPVRILYRGFGPYVGPPSKRVFG